jgi:hydrogenase/urease accessory protein HupE
MHRVSGPPGLIAWTALLLLLLGPPALAHPLKVGLATISVEPTQVLVELSVNLLELDLLLGLDRNLDARVESEEIESRRPELIAYLAERVKVTAGGAPLPLQAGPFRTGRASDGRSTFEVLLTFGAARALDRPLTIQCEPLTDLGPDHQTIATISREGRREQFVFHKGVVYRVEERGAVAHVVQFLGLGVRHILVGYDHIAFLVGLLLLGGGWWNLLAIVTSFTLAHSVTLSLAVLGLVTLPGRLVEAGIAFSVAYVGLENLLGRQPRRRWLVSFLFGFVHGFGLAGVLRDMALPRSALASSLLFFNLGVEVGQLLVVAITLPLLWVLGRGALHRAVVRVASLAILAVGVLWLYQRAF